MATSNGIQFVEIEIVCSNVQEHKKRVESRVADIPALSLPTWKDVQNREYESWSTERVTIDTSQSSPDQSTSIVLSAIKNVVKPDGV